MFSDDFHAYKSRVLQYTDKFAEMTEEATKNALIMPFLMLLGYDVFNPDEVIPEYVCDVAGKKGEKIDYVVMHDGEPVILIEAKRAGLKLQKQQQGQLYRYFSTSHCRLAILTNGNTYNFYSDINSPNVMDDDPFLSFDILNDDEELFLSSLEQFHKNKFNIKEILSKAVFLKYVKVVEQTLKQDLVSPSDELVKYFLSRPEIKTGGRITTQIIEKHRAATAEAMQKVMGITISKESTKVPGVQSTADDPVSDYIKQNFPEIECKQECKNGVTTIFLFKNGAMIGRIRFSLKNRTTRYDYTESATGKLIFIHDIEEYKDVIS